jgi:arabinogalactan endo-1,4-beta-galactosidase
MKNIITLLLLLISSNFWSQNITISSFNQNPIEISPLLGGNLVVNFNYTSEQGATNNHVYIGLEVLNSSNQYVKTISEVTLQNRPAGTNVQGTAELFISSILPLSTNLPTGQYYQVKAILYASGGWSAIAWAGYWNTPSIVTQNNISYTFSNNPINLGADVSWMTQMQSSGFIWKDNNGTITPLIPLLASYNLNAIRLRVWVNPSASAANGWCDIVDVVNKATLAKNQGMDVMLSLHYSDHWADPGTQTKPSAWSNYTTPQLITAVYNHTIDVLNALATVSITPKWIQIGNETSDGMLWTTGKASTGGFSNYANFINAGTQAVKDFNSQIKTILHLANGDDNNVLTWNINGLLNNGLISNRLDIIGLSLYALENNWKSKVDSAYSNILSLQTNYNKEIMIVETGFPANNPTTSYQFLRYLIEKTRLANGKGVFYWEPIAYNWNNYPYGAWDNDGSPSVAMDAFKNSVLLSNDINLKENNFTIYPNPTSNFLHFSSTKMDIYQVKIFDFNGRLIYSLSNNYKIETIDISSLSNGMYLLKINENYSNKFIKNN